jgi:hypothetical protein
MFKPCLLLAFNMFNTFKKSIFVYCCDYSILLYFIPFPFIPLYTIKINSPFGKSMIPHYFQDYKL